MSRVSQTQFHSKTEFATRWKLEIHEPGVEGYVIALQRHSSIPYPFMAVVRERYHEEHGTFVRVLTISEPDPETEYTSLDSLRAGREEYLRIALKTSDSEETTMLRMEGLTAMVMHGKLGPIETDEWRDRWIAYATK